MRHMHRHGGRDRHSMAPADASGHGHGHGHGHGPARGRRPFDYGALRLIVLGMMAEAPRHGYELIKAIEERMGGGYSPSPGVIYPTLSWLEDMGYAVPEAQGGRRSYRITPEGRSFLAANRAALDEISARMGKGDGRRNAPEPVMAAMDRLKRALRARFAAGAVEAADAETIATAILTAAENVEGMTMTETISSAPAGSLTSSATVVTPKAASYAAQLVKHFAHKIPARFEGSDGEVAFSAGICRLHVEGDRLTMTIEGATPEAIATLQDVVARHLERFAFREELAVDWS